MHWLLRNFLLLGLVIPFTNVHALEDLSSVGGTFIYGHVNWKSDVGNVVTFHVEAAYRRNIQSGYWKNGQAQVGDVLLMSEIGIGTSVFMFGDGFFTDELQLTVTAYSKAEDWVLGELTLTHEYAAPTDSGRPWTATLSGCCRLESLTVQKDSNFEITTTINLEDSRHSAVARNLPMLTAYIQPGSVSGSVQLSNTFVNADDPTGTRDIVWSIQKPWDVGNAANFSSSLKSFASIDLYALATQSCSGEKCQCNNIVSGQTTGFGIGPACFFGLLRTEPDYYLQNSQLTVEGWVKARSDGYIMSVGPNRCLDGFCSLTARLNDCKSTYTTNPYQTCSISTLMIFVNATHVTVGHEYYNTGPVTILRSFSVCSDSQARKLILCSRSTVMSIFLDNFDPLGEVHILVLA